MMLMGPELYFPLGVFDSLTNDFQGEAKRSLDKADTFNLFLVARLKDGISKESATSAIKAASANLEQAFPQEQKDQTVGIAELPRLGMRTSPQTEGPLQTLSAVLLGLTSCVLLVVCLNLAGMLLARGHARRKEFAIRLALGGGRTRIVRQLLTEGLVLAAAGGGLGMLLATWSTKLLADALATVLPVTISFEATSSPAMPTATAFFCAMATLFFALGPALRLSRIDVLTDLQQHAAEDAGKRRRSGILPRHSLVVAQLALSLGLLIAAGLFVRLAQQAGRVELGFAAENTVITEVDGSLAGYDERSSLDLYRRLEERLATLPGVESASIAATAPFGNSISKQVRRAGRAPAPDDRPKTAADGAAFNAHWNAVGSDYFSTLGLLIKNGRAFTKLETGSQGVPKVAIVDEVLARKLWPDAVALGQRLQWTQLDASAPRADAGIEVVGIVAAMRADVFEKQPKGAVYLPFAQGAMSNAYLHVRARGRTEAAAQALVAPIRRELRATAPGLPVFKVRTLTQHVNGSAGLFTLRMSGTLFLVFGTLAMLVAVVGIYGTQAYAVSRRTREIGVRMALGALPRRIQTMILREGLTTSLAGVAIGLAIGAAVGQVLSSVFVDVQAFDSVTFSLAPAALVAAATMACWLPARRATAIAPMSALRSE